MTRRRPIDWFCLLRDLRYECGMGLEDVARKIGASSSSVKAWFRGRQQPRYHAGEALVDLYQQRLRREPPRVQYRCKSLKSAQDQA